MSKIPALVLAHGTNNPEKGGSGFRNLVEKGHDLNLPYEIVAVATPYKEGSIAKLAKGFDIKCIHLPHRPDGPEFIRLAEDTGAKHVMCSGFLWAVKGLPTWMVSNIHPGSRPMTNGMHGSQVHQRMIRARDEDGIHVTHVNVHFVPSFVAHDDGTNNYDTGTGLAAVPVEILAEDSADTLGSRVNAVEHRVQPAYLALIVADCIRLREDGTVWMEDPDWYEGRNLPYT